MRPLSSRTRISALVGLAIAIVVGVESVDPGERETEADRELARGFARVEARRAYKDYLIRELVAGRMTLAAVADEFLRVHGEDPAVFRAAQWTYAGASDREKAARNVLAYARARAPDAAPKLAADFARAFGHTPDAPLTPGTRPLVN